MKRQYKIVVPRPKCGVDWVDYNSGASILYEEETVDLDYVQEQLNLLPIKYVIQLLENYNIKYKVGDTEEHVVIYGGHVPGVSGDRIRVSSQDGLFKFIKDIEDLFDLNVKIKVEHLVFLKDLWSMQWYQRNIFWSDISELRIAGSKIYNSKDTYLLVKKYLTSGSKRYSHKELSFFPGKNYIFIDSLKIILYLIEHSKPPFNSRSPFQLLRKLYDDFSWTKPFTTISSEIELFPPNPYLS